MRILSGLVAGAAALAAAGPTTPSPPPQAILVLSGGKVFTGDAARPWAEAIALRGDRILAVGGAAFVDAEAGPRARRVALGGRVVIPGINDAHLHLGPEAGARIDTEGMDPRLDDVLKAVASAAQKQPAGTWLSGSIANAVLEDRSATRAMLDGVAPLHPVFLRAWTGHGVLINSAAIRALGLSEEEPDPPGGTYGRVPGTRKVSGMAQEYAGFALMRRLSAALPEAESLEALREFGRSAARLGITSVQNMSVSVPAETLARLLPVARVPVRVRIFRFPLRGIGEAAPGAPTDVHPGKLVTISGTKWILDGTPVERLAAMREPYVDRPGWKGGLDFDEAAVRSFLREARVRRDPIALHAVGDRTIDVVLAQMEQEGGEAVWRSLRPRIEHGDGLLPDHFDRVRRFGIVVVQNPSHFTLDKLIVQGLGARRAALYMPLQSLLKAGIPVAFGSDGPLNPYLNILFAVTHPANPPEALTREQAVTAYTRGAAYAEFAETQKGTLAPGMVADLAVLSQDIFTVPLGDLPKTESVLTILGGEITYDAAVLPPAAEPVSAAPAAR
jgi:predicted amidohydrolase YtcJ